METTQDKLVSNLVRAMNQALRDDHKLTVPRSALRASFLKAAGKNPHAFVPDRGQRAANRPNNDAQAQLLTLAPTVLTALRDAEARMRSQLGLLKCDDEFIARETQTVRDAIAAVSALVEPAAPKRQRAKKGCFEVKVYFTPASWTDRVCDIDIGPFSTLPEATKLANAAVYAERYQVTVQARGNHKDYQPDQEVFVRFQRTAEDAQRKWPTSRDGWLQGDSVLATINRRADLRAAPAPAATPVANDVPATPELREGQHKVRFEWVWPDEDSGSCEAVVDVRTGEVTPLEELPDDVESHLVRQRIIVTDCADKMEEDIDIYWRNEDRGGRWLVRKKDMPWLRELLGVK